MNKSHVRLFALFVPLLLGACGEGWEMQKVSNFVPYGKRTAGSGVAYVRAQMMPEKELKIEPAIEEPVAAEPVLDAEEIFVEAQEKGGVPVSREAVSETHVDPEARVGSSESVDAGAEFVVEDQVPVIEEQSVDSVEGGHAVSDNIAPPPPLHDVSPSVPDGLEVGGGIGSKSDNAVVVEGEEHSAHDAEVAEEVVQDASVPPTTFVGNGDTEELSAENYIAHSAKKVDEPGIVESHVDVVEDVQSSSGAITAASQALAAEVSDPVQAEIDGESVDVDAYVFKEKVEEPIEGITAPKSDFIEFVSEGQDNLEEIYSDPLTE